jgi:GTP-binding protein
VTGELTAFSEALAARPRLVALNKVDLPAGARTAAEFTPLMAPAFSIAAATGEGCRTLLEAAAELARAAKSEPHAVGDAGPAHRLYRHRPARDEPIVSREGAAFRVSGAALERLVAMTDLESEEAVARLQRRLRRAGVDAALAAAGCADGDTVRVGEAEFDYVGEAPPA